MKTRLLPVLLALALGTVSACSSDAPDTPAPSPVSLSVDAPRVTLTTPGEGNRQIVVFKDAGNSQDVHVALSDGFDQGTGEAPGLPTTPPENPNVDTLSALLRATTSGEDPRQVSVQMIDPKHSSIAYASDVYSTAGFELGWTAKSSGQSEKVQLTAPTESTDQGRAIAELYLMKLLAQPVIFPTDPIAPGASWTVENRVAGDSTMLRTTTYTLLANDGKRVELDATISERPAVSALNLDGQGGEGELKVLSSESKGSGHIELDLSSPLPTSGLFSLTTRVTYGQEKSPKRVFQDFHSGIEFS